VKEEKKKKAWEGRRGSEREYCRCAGTGTTSAAKINL